MSHRKGRGGGGGVRGLTSFGHLEGRHISGTLKKEAVKSASLKAQSVGRVVASLGEATMVDWKSHGSRAFSSPSMRETEVTTDSPSEDLKEDKPEMRGDVQASARKSSRNSTEEGGTTPGHVSVSELPGLSKSEDISQSMPKMGEEERVVNFEVEVKKKRCHPVLCVIC